MTDTLSKEGVAKKRGRPRKHANAEEKAAADTTRKRAKRQLAVHLQRDQLHTTFYGSVLPSMMPPHTTSNFPHEAIVTTETGTGYGIQDGNAPMFVLDSGQPSTMREITNLLPPISPEFEPAADTLLPDCNDSPLELYSPMREAVSSDDASDIFETGRTTVDDYLDAETETNANAVSRLASRIAGQLVAFHGCCANCHEQNPVQQGEATTLTAYIDSATGLCPDILGSTQMASQKDPISHKTDAAGRRRLFCGLDNADCPQRIHLRNEDRVSGEASVTFDIDSVTGFTSSIAVAKQGIRWFPTQMAISDLQSNLHLPPMDVHFSTQSGDLKRVRRPVHEIPHYTFGRIIGFEEISIYFLFPHLYREEQQCSRLRDEDFRLWMDGVLLPILYRHYSSAHTQHYPSSYDHSRYNATARGVELHAQRVEPVARQQQLMYYLQPEKLSLIWEEIAVAVEKPGLHQFCDIVILLQAKNLKVLTKDSTWTRMKSRFFQHWDTTIDSNHMTETLFFDVGKETCRTGVSSLQESGTGATGLAETLLYKRCCLESYASETRNNSTPEHTQNEVFYNFGMLRDSGSLTIETGQKSPLRHAGLLYTQFYNSVKEIFAAGNVYPFTNSAIETLALDKKLRKTWELVGGGLSHQPAALIKAYLYTKLRCHFGLESSRQKSFGIREEHRVSNALFQAIDVDLQRRNMSDQQLQYSNERSTHYYSLSTETTLRWLRWNINKFCVGFETVHSFQDPHFVTWEHTRMMLMFLRCLQLSSSGLIQKIGGCWQDVKLRPDPDQTGGIQRCEGLGFRHNMENYGYAWFMDKIDWTTLTFKQPYA